jgi:DNA-binding beta-propeller fold protein YncE
VDVDARQVVRRYALPGRPHNLAVSLNGTVAATLPSAGVVILVGPDTVKEIEVGGAPHDIKPAGDRFLVTNERAGRVDRIFSDGRTDVSTRLRAKPHDLAITLDGRSAWVSLDGSSELAEVPVVDVKSTRYLEVGGRPHDLLFAPDGKLWLSDWNGSARVLSLEDGSQGRLPQLEAAHHLAFSPRWERAQSREGDREGWVTDNGGRRVVVFSDELAVLASIPVPGAPHHVTLTADGEVAAVANHEGGSLVLIDVKERRLVGEVPVGDGPHGVWAAAPGRGLPRPQVFLLRSVRTE